MTRPGRPEGPDRPAGQGPPNTLDGARAARDGRTPGPHAAGIGIVSPAQEDANDPAIRVRKARDGVLVVPLLALALLMPPIAQIFAIDGRILGIPVAVGYIFSIWLVVVLLARRAGRRILETEASADGGVGLG